MATEVHTFYTSSATTHASKNAPQLVEDLLSKYQSTIYASSPSSPSPSLRLAVKPRPSIARRIIDRVCLEYYRYEVTFGVYVMSPGEKWVANTFVVVFLSLLIWALFFYFPPLLYHKLSRLIWLLTGHSSHTTLRWNMFDKPFRTQSLGFPTNTSLGLPRR